MVSLSGHVESMLRYIELIKEKLSSAAASLDSLGVRNLQRCLQH